MALEDGYRESTESWASVLRDLRRRIISLEGAQQPVDYYDAILRMGELGVLETDFARELAPMAGFRNVLVQAYVAVDWGEVNNALHRLEDFERFARSVRRWLASRASKSKEPDQ